MGGKRGEIRTHAAGKMIIAAEVQVLHLTKSHEGL